MAARRATGRREEQLSDLFRTAVDVRYRNDPTFHALVDLLRAHLENSSYTPMELREACHLAACMYEMEHIKPLLIDPQNPFRWNTREATRHD